MFADATAEPLNVAETAQLAVKAAVLLQLTEIPGTGGCVTVTVVVPEPVTLPPVAVTFAVNEPDPIDG